MKLLIKNVQTTAYLLDRADSDLFERVNILIEDKIITKISDEMSDEMLEGSFDRVIDGGGHFISPGLCDPQVHFREPGQEYKEDITSGSKAAAKGGFTTVISMPNTTPTADTAEVVSFMKNKSKDIGICRVLPTGAVSLSLKGESLAPFAELKEAGAIALTDDGKGIQSDELFEKAMIEAKKVNLPLLDHSEDESLSNGGSIHLGAISNKYDLKGIDSASEAVHVERGCRISEKTGAHYHVLHVSTMRSIEAVRAAKKKKLNITCEVSPHHLLLCDEDIPQRDDGSLNANWKMNPPLRSSEDRAACVEALVDGTIDAIATDHAPHSPEEKAMRIDKAPFGIIGLETAFSLIYTNFVKTNKITLSRCIDLMSKDAGGIFGLKMGKIRVGESADLALFDLDHEFEITENFFASKSKNSPFIGRVLYGKTKLTLFEGSVSYEDL